MNKLLTLSIICGLVCLLAACRKEAVESSEYLELMDSNWGIGITLGSSRETVVGVLKEPDYETEAANKLSTDLQWIPISTDDHGPLDSQLRITLEDDAVTRMMCIKKLPTEEDETSLDPPFLLKPAAGCTIGSLKTDFVSKLGTPTTERTDTLIWDHESITGNRLRITAVFAMDDELGTSICHSVAVQTGKPLGQSLAEEQKKEQKIY